MNIRKNVIHAAVLTMAMAASASVSAATVEVLHWWTSGGEAHSVAELKKLLESQGDTWKDVAVAGGGGDNASTVLKSRIVSGSLPTAAQIKGPSIQEWGEQGVLADLSDTAKAGNWDALLPPVVSNVMKYRGKYVAVPVNVHRVNWMWVNPAAFKKAGVEIPKTWDEFPAAADKLQKAGITPVAHGGQPWQDFTLFESIVLGVGGPEFYQKAFVKLDQASLKSSTMEKAFETLRMVRRYIDKDAANRDWNLATATVINGKAAMQFMGDWAKGEFTAAGKVPGKDYLCLPALGTDNAFTFNIDSLVMFKQSSADGKKAIKDLSTAVMSPQFQEVFNLNKGSIPARLDVSLAKFDDCAKRSSQDFVATSKSGTLVPSAAHKMAMSEAISGGMQDVVTQFFNSTSMTTKAGAEGLAAAARNN